MIIKISCKKDGFWRAGLQHFKQPKEYDTDELGEKRMALLLAEPKLTIEEVHVEPAGEKEVPESEEKKVDLIAAEDGLSARESQLLETVWQLADVPEAQTKGSGPTVKAMEEIMGDVTVAERDWAYQRFCEQS
jgi:hypothetical protein